MKIGRTEKCWLAAVFFFWVFYNFPGFPAYGNETACIVHGLISFIGTAQEDTHPAAETERNR